MAPKWRKLYPFMGIAVIVVVTHVLAVHFVPELITKAYNRESVPWINNLISGRDVHSLSRYLEYWNYLTSLVWKFWIFLFLSFFIAWLSASPRRRDWYFTRFVHVDTPESLALIRIFTCGILSIHVAWESLASSVFLPRTFIQHQGFMRLLHMVPGFDALLADYTAVNIIEHSTQFLLLLGLLGYKTRAVLPLATFGYFILGGILREISWFTHVGLIPFYLLITLCFVRCSDAWSVDRYLSGEPVSPLTVDQKVYYGWARHICWMVIALPYLMSGLSKIRHGGFYWWHPDNLRHYILTDSLAPMEFDWRVGLRLVEAPDAVVALFGLGGMLGELFYVTVLFSARCRVVMPLLMAGMHLGILFLQNVFFFLWILQLMVPLQVFMRKVNKASRDNGNHPVWDQRSLLAPKILGGILILCSYVYIFEVEAYPLSAFSMYSDKNLSSKINYFKILAYGENGSVERAYPEKVIPAMHDARYRRLFFNCFRSGQYQRCEEFLAICGILHNDKTTNEKIEKFEAQYIQWDYKSAPRDPNYGSVVQSFSVVLKDSGRNLRVKGKPANL